METLLHNWEYNYIITYAFVEMLPKSHEDDRFNCGENVARKTCRRERERCTLRIKEETGDGNCQLIFLVGDSEAPVGGNR
ncbi:hypothetical protein PMI11_01914 [Rhizobium sp. CF142]|nr:hypothetical protein PMI11_01914 [Rhizobium sp. CF142]